MKKLIPILLILALLIPGMTALAEDTAPVRLGYIAPAGGENSRYSLCADAFAYAAEQRGAILTTLRYDPAPVEIPEDAEGEARLDPAVAALMSLIEEGAQGVAVVPTTLDQAVRVIDAANAAGVAIVIEGLDVSSAYPTEPDAAVEPEETPEPAEARPYVAAIGYGDAAAYAAAMWLEDAAYNPVLFHCALPTGDATIQAGLRRAIRSGRYLELADELNAQANSSSAGRDAVDFTISAYTMFGCVLADSAALAVGCSEALKAAGQSMPVAAVDGSADALNLLKSGGFDMLAAAPASVEGVQTFKVLYDYMAVSALPETDTGFVQLTAITATPDSTAGWIGDSDFASAYALAYPNIAE